jgi:UDP-N-acetylmuramate--alanine ligase
MDAVLAKSTRVHFTGIKGVAMTALALYCRDRGVAVTGSDIADRFPTDEALRRSRIPVTLGFDPAGVPAGTEAVVYTGAHGGRDNPQVVAAAARGIPVFPHGKALGELMSSYRQISVAGSHGKTTTSAMIAYLLEHMGYRPSYAIGAGMILPDMLPGYAGDGAYFVAEADEYITDPGHDPTPRFLWQHPEIAVVTNIDFDHPDAYADLAAVDAATRKFAADARTVIVNADDPNSRGLAETAGNRAVSYGRNPTADYRVEDVSFAEGRTRVRMSIGGAEGPELELAVPGLHNAANAAAALAVCHTLGIDVNRTAEAISGFTGTLRRCQRIGVGGGTIVYDDYAHHPNEIKATLAGLRAWFPNRKIAVVFQPHTYSRTKALLPEFAVAFTDASEVYIADIYASARERDTMGMHASVLVDRIIAAGKPVWYAGGKDTALALVKSKLAPGDIVVFMGAGDIYDWSREYLAAYA